MWTPGRRLLRLLQRFGDIRVAIALTIVLGAAGGAYAGFQPKSGVLAAVALRLPVLVCLAWLGAFFVLQYGIYRRLDEFETEDQSAEPGPPPEHLRGPEAALLAAGFRPVGRQRARLSWQDWQATWAYVDPSGYVSASLGLGRRPSMTTAWSDGSFVLTRATGSTTRAVRALVLVVGTKADVAEMYRRHVEAARAFGATRGLPVPETSMGDVHAVSRLTTGPSREILRAMLLRPSLLVSYGFLVALMLALLVVLPA
jgi:hypothetical protein